MKESKVCFLNQKSMPFQVFQCYLAQNERSDLWNHQSQTDKEAKNDSNE